MTTTTDFTYDVFISYARRDGADKAEALADSLRERGIRAYYDLYQNEPGIDWWKRIETAITRSKSFVFILTNGSVESDVCAREWETAETLKRPILPIRVVDSGGQIISNIPEKFGRIHYIETVKDWSTGVDEIEHFVTRYDYLYGLRDELAQLVSESTARRFIEIIGKEKAEAKRQLKRKMRVKTIRRNAQLTETEFESFSEAWTHYDGQVLLLGDPGAGKTTTLLYHAQQLITAYLADRNQPVPVFATIAFWDSYADTPLHEWLPDHNELPDDMREVIRHGRAVLILDGLDELGSSKPINPEKPEEGKFDPRQRFIQRVQETIDDGNQVIMTSRVKDYVDIGEKLDIRGAIELQKLTDEQIATYLGDVPVVQEEVMKDAGLLDICRSPLLLSLIAFGYRDATDDLKALPSMAEGELRDAIFGQYIQASYDFETDRRALIDEEMPFTLEKTLDVLGYAAMINVAGGIRDLAVSFNNHDVVENILIRHDFTHQLQESEVDRFLRFLLRLNVLEKVEVDQYRFLHLLIRDFLAFTFAMQCEQQGINIASSNMIDDPFTNVNLSMRVLTNLKDLRFVSLAIKKLEHKNEHRYGYAHCLGEIGNERAYHALSQTLANDDDTEIREACAEALGRIGGERATSVLIETLATDTDVKIRGACAEALGRIGGERATSVLIETLANDSEAFVRWYSAVILARIKSKQSIDALIEALNDTEIILHVGTIAQWVAESLEEIGTPEAMQAVDKWRKSQSNG